MANLIFKITSRFLIVVLIFLSGLQIINYNRVAVGAKIAGLNFGGLKLNQAEKRLSDRMNQFQHQTINLIYRDKSYPTNLNQLGLQLNRQKSLSQIFVLGKNEKIFSGISEQIQAIFGRYNLEVNFSLDQEKLENFILSYLSELENPAQEPRLIFNQEKNDFEIIDGQTGQIIDRQKLKNDLRNAAANLSAQSIFLNLINDYPYLSKEQAKALKEKALIILDKAPYFLIHQDKQWAITKEKIGFWLDFDSQNLALNQKAEEYLQELAKEINQEPVSAQLTMENDKVTIFSLPQNGLKLDIQTTLQNITQKIISDQSAETIAIAFETIEPEITTNEKIENLGLTGLLSSGESDFNGSPQNRVHNIQIGAAKMNGLLIKPGETFSFNQLLGPVGPEQGYRAELVIKKDKTIPEYGGGLCQVSTTLFRAAINSGLKITERYPHAFPVKYYNPQGFDATIYPPHPDLKFINDTENYLLIQSKIKDTQLIFEIYGAPDGRETKIIGPTILSQKPDGSMKTILTQEIWRNGELERQDIFRSNYKSPALYPVERNPLE